MLQSLNNRLRNTCFCAGYRYDGVFPIRHHFSLRYSTDIDNHIKPIVPETPENLYIKDKINEYSLSKVNGVDEIPLLKKQWDFEKPEIWLKYQLKFKKKYEIYLNELNLYKLNEGNEVKRKRKSTNQCFLNESYLNNEHHEPLPLFGLYVLDKLNENNLKIGLNQIKKNWRNEPIKIKKKYESIYIENKKKLVENGLRKPTKPLSPMKLFAFDKEKFIKFPKELSSYKMINNSRDFLSIELWDKLPIEITSYYDQLYIQLYKDYQNHVKLWNSKHPNDIVRRKVSSFFLFRDEYIAKTKFEKGDDFIVNLTNVSEAWDKLSIDEKSTYEEKAILFYNKNKTYGDKENKEIQVTGFTRRKKRNSETTSKVSKHGIDNNKMIDLVKNDEYRVKPHYSSGKSIYIDEMIKLSSSSSNGLNLNQLESNWNNLSKNIKTNYERTAFEKFIKMTDIWNKNNSNELQIDYFSKLNVSKYVGFISNRDYIVDPFICYMFKMKLSYVQAKSKWENESEEIKQQIRKEVKKSRKLNNDEVLKHETITISSVLPRLTNSYLLFQKLQNSNNNLIGLNKTKGFSKLWKTKSNEIKKLYSDLAKYDFEIALAKCVELKEANDRKLGLTDSESGIIKDAIINRYILCQKNIEETMINLRKMGEDVIEDSFGSLKDVSNIINESKKIGSISDKVEQTSVPVLKDISELDTKLKLKSDSNIKQKQNDLDKLDSNIIQVVPKIKLKRGPKPKSRTDSESKLDSKLDSKTETKTKELKLKMEKTTQTPKIRNGFSFSNNRYK